MNIRIKNVFLPLSVVFLILSSCYPVGDLTYSDLDIAATLYDKSYYSATPGSEINKFQNLKTFIVADTIIHVVASGQTDNLSRANDAFVLEQIRLNMIKVGFTEITDTTVAKPDLVITTTAISSENEVYMWYPYWGWYWGYGYYPYSTINTKSANYYNDYYYPWYGYGSSYTYTTGTLLMEMVEASRIDPANNEIPVIWSGILNGLLGDTQSSTKSRVSKGIDQCFNQSPYLFKTTN
jgi:hypothetical protein